MQLEDEPLSPGKSFTEVLMDPTAESPLLVCGTILSRTRKSGKNERGDWTIFVVEVRGSEGRTVTVLVNDPDSIPPKGDFAIIPCFLSKNGDLRECRKFGEEF